ncbi:hypothetical protein [Rhodohalobacter sp. 8-1]|uniref:hypothetical protein n=1 Tax=Rhodohalobacter sp. 8-1 TaxID=3131972 RepID=UPI0030EC0622
MDWAKQIIVDLFALIVIASAVMFERTVLTYIVYIYTALMIIARLFSLLSGNFRSITQKKVTKAPLWVYHLIYALTVAVLLFGQWYITAAGWAFIWISAIIVYKKNF